MRAKYHGGVSTHLLLLFSGVVAFLSFKGRTFFSRKKEDFFVFVGGETLARLLHLSMGNHVLTALAS